MVQKKRFTQKTTAYIEQDVTKTTLPTSEHVTLIANRIFFWSVFFSNLSVILLGHL